jgi:glycerophosphoryl diester phosphodiesterase
MPKYPYRDLGVNFDRNFRNALNANFDDIEADIKELGAGAQQALEAAEEANTQAIYAQTSGDYANDKGDYAAQQGDYAQTQGNFAYEKGVYAQQQGDYAKQVADENKTRWLNPVATFADIATTYPNPQHGDTVQTINDGKVYRYEYGQWKWNQQITDIAIADVQNKIGILNRNISSKYNFEVEIIAHRGFSHIAPENTVIAMETAISYGADSLEFDVQISSDGVPVCIHDSTVDRTTDGTGNVKDLTLAQLQALDAGSFLSPIYAGVKIPTLDDVLKVAKRKSKYIYPEIKGYRNTDDIPLIVNKIIEHGFEDKCVIQSFNYNTDFPIVRTISKRITLGYLVSTESGFNDALSKASVDGNGTILTEYHVVLNNPTLVKNARAAGADVVVWTVDNLYDMQSLFEIGVVRIMTNRARGGII